MVTVRERDFSDFEFWTVPSERLTAEDRALMLALFDACVRQGGAAGLESG